MRNVGIKGKAMKSSTSDKSHLMTSPSREPQSTPSRGGEPNRDQGRKNIETRVSRRDSPATSTVHRERPRGSRGRGYQSNLRQLTIKDVFGQTVLKETSNNRELTESTEKKVKTESTATEKKESICVSYIWENEGIVRDTTDLDTPIIEFAKANPSPAKKSGYLFICARNVNAIVNPWVPCGALQESEVLELKVKKMTPSSEQNIDNIMAPEKYKYPVFPDSIFLKVSYQGRTGGGKPVKILHKMQYYGKHKHMAVLGYPGETIHQALQNDKRFAITGQFSLEDSSCTRHKSHVLLSDLTPNDKYTIVVENCLPRKTLANKDVQNNEGSTSSVPNTSAPQSEPYTIPCHQPKAVSSRVSSKFSSEFKKFAKIIGEEQLKSELEENFRYNVVYKDPMMATTFQLLNKHLDNVALLTYNVGHEIKSGTLFLLTAELGITCYHVVELLIESHAVSNVKVIFNYESEEKEANNRYKKVEWHNKELDCAFVRVKISEAPPGLLNYIAPPPQDGAVTIIGYPQGKPKQIDLQCSVINYHKRAESIAGTLLSDRSYIHVLTKYSFMYMSDKTLMTYDSCLYEGSSGSPVFNNCGELVAVHTGGYLADTSLKKKSVIEYGRSAVDIVIHGAIHLQEVGDLFRKLVKEKENLHRYLQPGEHPDKMQPIIRQLLQQWKKSDSQIEQNPGVNTSDNLNDVSDSEMDTST
ncbi:serine protease FAM111A-like isoform X2 [Bufo bufo]|uniref:serine protease FAM111A-like isoform X2 n=1 Tax=Bufo bufo TaxID=8384 RepID=UPI001ABE2C3A|nr:serine protease FAM111A-like isoform X2 [Bufo bufo]